VRLGNCRTADVEAALRARHADVLAFAADPGAALPVLSRRDWERGATGRRRAGDPPAYTTTAAAGLLRPHTVAAARPGVRCGVDRKRGPAGPVVSKEFRHITPDVAGSDNTASPTFAA
jgi:hypothetical protein